MYSQLLTLVFLVAASVFALPLSRPLAESAVRFSDGLRDSTMPSRSVPGLSSSPALQDESERADRCAFDDPAGCHSVRVEDHVISSFSPSQTLTGSAEQPRAIEAINDDSYGCTLGALCGRDSSPTRLTAVSPASVLPEIPSLGPRAPSSKGTCAVAALCGRGIIIAPSQPSTSSLPSIPSAPLSLG